MPEPELLRVMPAEASIIPDAIMILPPLAATDSDPISGKPATVTVPLCCPFCTTMVVPEGVNVTGLEPKLNATEGLVTVALPLIVPVELVASEMSAPAVRLLLMSTFPPFAFSDSWLDGDVKLIALDSVMSSILLEPALVEMASVPISELDVPMLTLLLPCKTTMLVPD